MMILEINYLNGFKSMQAVHWVSCVAHNGKTKLVAMTKAPATGFMGLGPIIDLDDPQIEAFNVLEEAHAASPDPVL